MSSIVLRDYQQAAIDSLYEYFRTHSVGNPVIALPTGTGKSIVIGGFLHSIFIQWSGQRILILTHVKELIKQNYEKLAMMWDFAPAGIYSAGLNRRDQHAPITFAGIASVAKKAAMFGHIDLVMIDEAHLLSPNDKAMYQKFLKDLRSANPYLKVIGLTATPWRLGHGHIADGQLFDDVCFDLTTLEGFNWLIAQGHMSPLIPKRTKLELSTDGVHKQAGEFKLNELQVAVDKNEVTYAALKEALSYAHDRQHWLIFASGVEHADHISEMLDSMGETCLPVHSKMDSRIRDENIKKFQRGEVRMIVNNNILTTGFDSPWIDCIVCLRPTASSVLWVQMLGRGTRPFSTPTYVKQNCLVLDFAGNTRRLGPVNDPVIPRKAGEGGGEAPVKECPVCNVWNHISARKCIHCGTEFRIEVKIKAEASYADLIKGELPKTAAFKVDHITFSRGQNPRSGKPAYMKASYFCGLRVFDEFICFEHGGFAAKRARDWWKVRSDSIDPPKTVKEALSYVSELSTTTHINVWMNKPGGRPEIMSHCFDGTNFNSEQPSETLPEVEVRNNAMASTTQALAEVDNDIPF